MDWHSYTKCNWRGRCKHNWNDSYIAIQIIVFFEYSLLIYLNQMKSTTIITLIFIICYVCIAAITVPLSIYAYISASVACFIHYAVAQLLVCIFDHAYMDMLIYSIFAILSLCCGTVGVITSYGEDVTDYIKIAFVSQLAVSGTACLILIVMVGYYRLY